MNSQRNTGNLCGTASDATSSYKPTLKRSALVGSGNYDVLNIDPVLAYSVDMEYRAGLSASGLSGG